MEHIDLTDYGKPVSKEVTGAQLLTSKYELMPCLIDPILQRVGIACLAGSSDTGKSTLLRQLAIAITTGESKFLDFNINATHRSVICVITEDMEAETSFLLKRQAGNRAEYELQKLRFIFDSEDTLKTLDESLTNQPADAVIIDCFSDVFSSAGGDLKDTQKIRSFLNPFQELARKHQCLVLFLHHTGKRTEQFEPSKNNLLSGQGFEAKVRLVIEFRADLINPALRHFCIVKGNYLHGRYKKESFVLHFDENTFLFTDTGERMPFEMLAKKDESENHRNKYQVAIDLKKSGLTHQEIADKIGYTSRGSVTKLFERGTRNGWDKSSDSITEVEKVQVEEVVPF
jgi:hypothetical protein